MAVPLERAKKWGSCLGTRAPSSAFPFVSVVFTLTRGVIHPSFPLRGRWERTLKSVEQAPSPSLITLLNSSSETRQRKEAGHAVRQYSGAGLKPQLLESQKLSPFQACHGSCRIGLRSQFGTSSN